LTYEHSIILRGIKKKVEPFLLGPIDLEIPSGFITAIVGPNGSGKSTLFRMLMNLVKPDEGTLQVMGQTYPEHDVELKDRIGYMLDSTEVIDDSLRARQVKDFVRQFYTNWDDGEYERLIQRFKIDERMRLRRMSKGTQQKFALVQVLARRPELLLLDEPSLGLDPLAWRDMMDEISHYMEQPGHTVVIATHIIEEVRRLADYIVFMYEGQVLGMYEKDSLLENWREMWIEGNSAQLSAIDGICHVDPRQPNRLIADDYAKASAELKRLGIHIYQSQPIPLDEIMQYMIEKHRDSTYR
jgi:ABC-2 type transport system ATP-binding protein